MRARRSRGPGRPVVVAVVVAGVLLIAYSVLVRFTHPSDSAAGVQSAAGPTTTSAPLDPPVDPPSVPAVIDESPTSTPSASPSRTSRPRPTPSASPKTVAPPPEVTVTATTTATPQLTEFRQRLSELAPVAATNGRGPYEVNMSNGGKAARDGVPMVVHGQTFIWGFGVHPTSSLTFDLHAGYDRLETFIGINDVADPGDIVKDRGSAVFSVYADGALKYQSPVKRGGQDATKVTVDVRNTRQLRLTLTDGGNGSNWDHGVWAQPTLIDWR